MKAFSQVKLTTKAHIQQASFELRAVQTGTALDLRVIKAGTLWSSNVSCVKILAKNAVAVIGELFN